MPMFDFVCESCEHEDSKIVKLGETTTECPKCGKSMKKVDKLYRTGLQFKGRWYKTTKSY